jgi:hypothetical protein
MKGNRGMLWGLLFKAIVIQSVLLGLIFVNRGLLESVSLDFTSAEVEVRTNGAVVVIADQNDSRK